MKFVNKILIVVFAWEIWSVQAQTQVINNNLTDTLLADLNKNQKEHFKIFKNYALANKDKSIKQEKKKEYFKAYYNPISIWCTKAEYLYLNSSKKITEKIKTTNNPKIRQQLNLIVNCYMEAINNCQLIKKGFEKDNQVLMEININKYIDLEKRMNQLKIEHPVRDWIASSEGDRILNQQKQQIKKFQKSNKQINHLTVPKQTTIQ